MLDALSSAAPAAQNLAQTLVPPLPQDPAPAGQADPLHVDVNRPAYVSPAITFNPETNVVIITYRSAETGKVTEQYPPSSVASKYNAVDDTGQQSPALPLSTSASGATHPAPTSGSASASAGTPTPPAITPPASLPPAGTDSTASTIA